MSDENTSASKLGWPPWSLRLIQARFSSPRLASYVPTCLYMHGSGQWLLTCWLHLVAFDSGGIQIKGQSCFLLKPTLSNLYLAIVLLITCDPSMIAFCSDLRYYLLWVGAVQSTILSFQIIFLPTLASPSSLNTPFLFLRSSLIATTTLFLRFCAGHSNIVFNSALSTANRAS